MNQAQMMAQMKKMQAEMAKAQEDLASTVVSGSAGGGAVTVDMTCGDNRVSAVKLAKEAIDPDDAETLEDLLVIAINDAVGKAHEASQKRMSSVTGGLRIPGLM